MPYSYFLSFNYQTYHLPVAEIVDTVKQHLSDQPTLIVNAPPGAGKSTLLPLTLLEEKWLKGRKIIMLEPRRLAAKTIAMRMAQMIGEDVGQTVGYRIRFENRVSDNTRLEVVTEGILTRMLHTDNAIEDVALVIFDEFHERSIHADVALALCREAQQILRPDLRIMIMSATLNMPQLVSLLKAPVAVSEGKLFPVDIHYAENDSDDSLLPELVARQVARALANHTKGDVLVFLPGEGEIRRTEELLQGKVEALIHPLYGQLPPREQFLAIMPNQQGKRKVVLATSIAETSLTIEGVKIVVDCGFSRVSKFDPKSGLSRLETVRISKDSANQRAGRAGRLSEGFCYRMWTKATHQRLAEHRIPEIEETDLCNLVLDMTQWGILHIEQMAWLSPPPKPALALAKETLVQLGAIENGKITAHGKELHALPCHPRIAHMLLMPKETHLKQLATDIAAILEERDFLPKESGIDINLRIEALRRGRKNNSLGKRITRIEKIAESYRRMIKVEVDNDEIDVYETGLLLAYAYPERIAYARPGNNAQFQLSNGKYAMAGHKDAIANEPWLAVAHIDAREGTGKIFLASPLNPKDLLPMVKEKEMVTWDVRKGGLVATKDLRLGSIVLQSKPLPDPDKELITQAKLNALKNDGKNLLDFDESMLQLQNRLLSLRKWNPDEQWPDVSTEHLLNGDLNWLRFQMEPCKKNEDFKKINLAEALYQSLDWDQQQKLDQLAPPKLEVPTGSKIKIEYFENGSTPVLAVRLQEIFGLLDTPKINQGKQSVVMHLLSPGYKPVQITSDLKSFWSNAYFETKKELQRRYPKHSWPDDPLKAIPVAKGRSHKH